MMKNIETMTANDFLRAQIKKGLVPAGNCPIYAGEKIDFAPNSVKLKRSIDWEKTRKGIFGRRFFK